MPTYFYTAITAGGEKVSGSENAQDERELTRMLREQGYIVTSAGTGRAKNRFFLFQSFWNTVRPVPLTDKLLFTRNLQVMVAAGISLPKALDILSVQARNKEFRSVLSDLRTNIVKGQSLSEGMAQYPNIFSELNVQMIKAAEGSGTMEEALSYLALQLERQHEIRSKVKGAMIYPTVVVCAMVVIGGFMLAFVVPKLAETFEDLEVELPLTTRSVIALGDFLAQYWYLAIFILIVGVFALQRFRRTTQGKKLFDTVLLRFPVISSLIRKANTALMTRTLSSLLSAGVPIVSALEITSHVVGNWHFRQVLVTAAEEVRKGGKLSESLNRSHGAYPFMIGQMVAVGEETGETSQILKKLAEFFEQEVENMTQNLSAVIEPFLMLIIGAMVGLFAISMFQPMYSLFDKIQ